MQSIATPTSANHFAALQQFAAERAKASYPITLPEIEEYVSNLWHMDEDPFLYTTD